MSGLLRRLSDRLGSSQSEIEAEELRTVSAKMGGTPLSDCADREIVTCCGTVRSISVRPRAEHVPALVAELDDGSRTVRLVWLGRRRIVGVDPGIYLQVHGRMTMLRGTPTIFNPAYQLQPRD